MTPTSSRNSWKTSAPRSPSSNRCCWRFGALGKRQAAGTHLGPVNRLGKTAARWEKSGCPHCQPARVTLSNGGHSVQRVSQFPSVPCPWYWAPERRLRLKLGVPGSLFAGAALEQTSLLYRQHSLSSRFATLIDTPRRFSSAMWSFNRPCRDLAAARRFADAGLTGIYLFPGGA